MWADIASWFQSPGGARVLQTAIVPALAILVAGVLAALIARAAMRATLRRADREQAATAVAGLVEAARSAAEADGSRGDRRRAIRLRTEADVRVRLLPLKGADRAADWAGARTDELLAGTAQPDAVPALRDALIAWVAAPKRSRRLFPAAGPTAGKAGLARTTSSPARAEADPAPSTGSTPTGSTPTPSRDDAEVPAWQRTASVERLRQQQTARTRADEPDEDDTAPVRAPRSHRADPAPIAEVEQLERLDRADAQQPARHATAAVPVQEAAPAARPGGTPEWLDDYDDEAQVTQQNMDLRTPPPVSATTVRDRAPAGDIVPRP